MMNAQTELVKGDGAALAHTNGGDINMGLLFERVIDQLRGPGAEQAVAVMERLVDLQLKVNEKDNERRFNEDFAAMQSELPPIPRSKHVSISGGAKWDYAPLEQIEPQIRPSLKKYGFAYRFTNVDAVKPGNVRIRATLLHKNGHSVYAEFEGPLDNKNPVSDLHKTGGADTYARRRALTSVLGLVTCDRDTDAVELHDAPTITDHQRATIETLIADSGTDLAKFLGYYQIDVVDNLPASRYGEAVRALEKKRGAK